MSQHAAYRTPFVLGQPIKDPVDFYGRTKILQECYQTSLNGQWLAVVGEHRCGNTSVLYQLMHEEQRGKYLSLDEDDRLVFAFVSAQLGNKNPSDFLRRVARGLRKADPTAEVDFEADVDQAWLEDYLEDLSHRTKRLVLLIDEFEVVAHFDPTFWDWFQVLTTEYDVSIIASTHSDLGEFRAAHEGPAMFNMFRSLYIGSLQQETVDQFLADKSELTDFDFASVREELADLAGRFPFYLQSAAALFYFYAAGESRVTPAQIEEVQRDFGLRTVALFEDAWKKLPYPERDALTWMVLGEEPEGVDDVSFNYATRSLERRGYLVDGRVFSSALTDYIRRRVRPVGSSCTPGRARVGRTLVEVGEKEHELLEFLLDHSGRVVTEHEVAHAVWPEMGPQPSSSNMEEIWRTVQGLKAKLDAPIGGQQQLEILPDEGFRLLNPTNEERPWLET